MNVSETNPRPSYWNLLAVKIEQDPAVLVAVLHTIDRWLAADHSGRQRLLDWRHLIVTAQASHAGFSTLLRTLTSDRPQDVRLRDFSPFAGILTREERRNTRELCGYRH
jgi:hypothetical protein